MNNRKSIAQERLEGYEELYVQWYGTLIKRAMRLSGQDRASAEDLVQDVFVEMALSPPDFSGVKNLRAYLLTILGNIYASRMKRSRMRAFIQLSMADYDTAGLGLRMMLYPIEAQTHAEQISRAQARDELRRVCRYACVRKETSKIGGVLILRFFHGYYPDEAAQIAGVSRKMVYRWLQLARNEARIYLNDPRRLQFIKTSTIEMERAPSSTPGAPGSSIESMLLELQAMIFSARSGDCPSPETIRSWYVRARSEPIDGAALAHLVSCLACLDEANALIGLPPFVERRLGLGIEKESSVDDQGDDDNDPAGPGEKKSPPPPEKIRRMIVHRVRQAAEHRPTALYVTIDGEWVGGQELLCDRREQRLTLELHEIPKFIEIVSEQGLRLAMLTLGGAPFGIHRRVRLSEGRTVDAELSIDGLRPILRLAYHNPAMGEESSAREDTSAEHCLRLAEIDVKTPRAGRRDRAESARELLARLWAWARPASISQATILRWTVGGALAALIAVVVLWRSFAPAPVMAAPLLRRSIQAETVVAPKSTEIIHRTLQLEERAVGDSAVRARRTVEIWQGHESSPVRAVRRLYDENNRLIGGEWRTQNGLQFFFRRGATPPQAPPDKRNPAGPPTNVDAAIQMDLRTGNFVALLDDSNRALVEESAETHLITWGSKPEASSEAATSGEPSLPRLISASLILNKQDLRPIEQRLVVQGVDLLREFRFVETSFDRYPKALVPQTVFEIDRELSPVADSRRPVEPAAEKPSPIAAPEPAAPPVNASLEIKVIFLLGQENITLGDSAILKRKADGGLSLLLNLDDEARVESIRRLLAPMIAEGALTVEVRGRAQPEASPSATSPQNSPITKTPVIRERILAQWAARGERPTEEQLAKEINQIASTMMEHTGRAKMHALALRHAGGRFSHAQVDALDAETKSEYLTILQSHAAACESEILWVLRTLDEVSRPSGRASNHGSGRASISQSSGERGEGSAPSTALSFPAVIDRLVKLTAAQDAAMKACFSAVSIKKNADAWIMSVSFFRSLQEAEAAAAAVRKFAQAQ